MGRSHRFTWSQIHRLNHRPVSSQLEYEKKKKTEGKMVRAERQVVLDMLFSAFERHQYYNIKDLVDITRQPVVSEQHTHTFTNTQQYNRTKQYTCPLSTLLC